MMTPLLSRLVSRRAALTSAIGLAAFSVPDLYLAALATPDPGLSVEDSLRETEARRLLSLVEFDMKVADALHADDFQLINPAGGVLSKQDYLGGLEAGFLDYGVFEPVSDIAVRLYADAAALRYQSEIEIHFGDGAIDQGQFWHTDLYERRDGTWQVVWSQATRIA